MTVCNLSYKEVGPFNQTLFMGCSIVNVGMNLAWGAEQSSCTVKLFRDMSSHPSDPAFGQINTSNASTIANNTPSTLFDPSLGGTDTGKNLQKNIAKSENNKELERTAENVPDRIKDTGKKCWNPHAMSLNPANWLGPDPGFIGDNNFVSGVYSVMGVPCHFRFDDLTFGGFVNKWTFDAGSYSVDLQGPGSLLKGTQLILNNYYGSVSSLFSAGDSLIAVPTNDLSINTFNGTVVQGNVPNLINIFGYLQNTGFGSTLVTQYGINAAQVYDTLLLLLSNSQRQQNQFSPYGAIVGKSLLKYTPDGSTSIVDPASTYIKYNNTQIYLHQLGFLAHKISVDGVLRPLFRLDLSEVPRPDPNLYLPSQPSMSLEQFINFCCEGAGADWNAELIPDLLSSQFSGRIYIHTYNRNIQPPPKILKNTLTNFGPADRVVSYSVGEEYSDTNVRKIAIGGKQKRLFQVMSHTLSKYRNIRVFDPTTKDFIDPVQNMKNSFLNDGNSRNTVRYPLRYRTRNYERVDYGGASTAEKGGGNFYDTQVLGFSGASVTRGSYRTTTPSLASLGTVPEVPPGVSGGKSYPLFYDLISPYFGRNGDGSVRRVFYDRRTCQMQVNVAMTDITPFFPVYSGLGNGYITFHENEIRAAISGFDSWLAYVLEPTKLGWFLPTTNLIYAFIRTMLPANLANSMILKGNGILKTQSKLQALPTQPHTGDDLSPGSFAPYTGRLHDALSALHNFIANELGSNYGKNFLVRVPEVQRRVSSDGVAHYSYEICDAAWEEPGNFIDDTMQTDSSAALALSNEDGRFGPLLGYNASAEWDRSLINVSSGPATGKKAGLLPIGSAGYILQDLASRNSSIDSNKWYFPLYHDMPTDEVVLMPHTSYPGSSNPTDILFGVPQVNDSFGRVIPDNRKYKLYIKGSIMDAAAENTYNKKILFANGAQYCVVSAPNKVYYRSYNSLAYTLFNDLFLASALDIETPDGGPLAYNSATRRVGSTSLLFMIGLLDGWMTSSFSPPTVGLNSESHVPIAPKCAVPCFAAIPIQDNLSVYGPWISHPGLIRADIFPGVTDSAPLANNIVGGVDIDVNDSYVPWEYGGMSNLDSAVLSQLADNNKYQQTLEVGNITLAGIMLRNANLGSTFLSDFGPVINSIQLDIGEQGFRTTYHFRTYSRRLGYFNKEQADSIKQLGKNALSLRKLIIDNTRSTLAALQTPSSSAGASSNRIPKQLSYSPFNLLIGAAYPMVHGNSALNDVTQTLGWGPGWHTRPLIGPSISSNPKDLIRQQTVTNLYDPQEAGDAIFGKPQDYSYKSIMSLDGILSPISFYPTPYGSTYSITFYPRSKCPYCKGTGKYTFNKLSNISDLSSSSASESNGNGLLNNLSVSEINCVFCTADSEKANDKTKSARPNEITPPYLLASGTDRAIISDRNTAFQYNSCIINAYTLNPMVMSASGSEFSCHINKQNLDACGHSIDVVAFGNTLPSFADGLRASLSPTINKNFSDYDLNLRAADPSNPNAFQNVRSFGLRGPIMLHSWGYDLEGYPVPNASGEFKFQGNNVVRDAQGRVVYKNQQIQSDGSYSAPYKENTFYKGWAQLPSTWPVGPIDLRWDDNAKLWTIGSHYKPVWVVIETDLLNKNPVRGTVIESSYSNSPLPSGLRKLVFVRDGAGIFSAPRGAPLYCRYDSQNGFYEPIYNNPLVTSGLINGANTALIYTSYMPTGIDSSITNYNSSFDNPVNFDANIGSIGLFVFMKGNWVLQSINQ